MIVTRFKYPLETQLVKKLDLMIERCQSKKNKKDVVLLCEGAEGEGKTTLSIALAYYVSEQTGREFDTSHMFFDIEKMIDFAQNTEEQIIIWDEPALQALSTDWASSAVKNLTRLLMMARKKRHFIIINMTKFYKFNEYIVVDRAIALIHVYSRRNIESGRFQYIKKRSLEQLWRDYRFSKKRTYQKHASKIIRGTFPDVLSPTYKNNVLSEFENEKYEKAKDAAIMQIGKVNEKPTPAIIKKRLIMDYIIKNEESEKKMTQKEIADAFGAGLRTIATYAKEIKDMRYAEMPQYNNMGSEGCDGSDDKKEVQKNA